MKTPTFREQYDKIVGAYLRNELEPLDSCACFVGNLLNRNDNWGTVSGGKFGRPRHEWGLKAIEVESNGLYSSEDISELEYNFLFPEDRDWVQAARNSTTEEYEKKLFEQMESTLELLKQIHESKGEVIDNYTFAKRELVHE